MGFEVGADAYGRFMGRYSTPMAEEFICAAGVRAGQRALDVGCGPGALTTVLVRELGAEAVCAIDPSESFVAAFRDRLPEVDVRRGSAEALPYDDDTFDVAMAQLVVPFMADPVAGLREMARVTRPGGVVAACAWDHAGERTPLTTYWRAAERVEPGGASEANIPGCRRGHLAQLFAEAGFEDRVESELTIHVHLPTFEDWWEPMTNGTGPVGDHYARLDEEKRQALREAAASLMPATDLEITGTTWCVVGRV
ncbi:class I SAM-dependent methyltransferase [Nocardioides sp. Root151]|uniref:class I SAM-dependent methyltransferase n=1 Tax=Nocardioides sp. Root151 TaxID=1736475 RepID=UPI0007026617|nr:methyltransferase domain-containing protein [Nocardioides sp. Root151]KQZ67524.1 SAM-dependent methyltransferase [Nocardioides sp. Root151]